MGLQGFLWICPPDYASSQHADRKLGGASDQKGEPDLISCSSENTESFEMVIEEATKCSTTKQLWCCHNKSQLVSS